jgi:hypothetical protein
VFTLTALIDVLGRAHESEGAFWLFNIMPSHGLAPNVVTCVTSARVSIVHRHDEFFRAVMDELVRLYEAAQENTLASQLSPSCDTDVSLDNLKRMSSIVVMSSFECCIGAERFDLARDVLQLALKLQVSPSQDILVNVLKELYFEEFDDKLNSMLISSMQEWEAMAIIPPMTTHALQNSKSALMNNSTLMSGDNTSSSTHSHRESLGKNSPPELRKEVVEHDLSRLAYRLDLHVLVSKEDFETLIHQCRKVYIAFLSMNVCILFIFLHVIPLCEFIY